MSTPAHRPTAPRRATLKDVARAAGVSPSTTSRALSGEGYVAAAVRARVRRAAEQLGYVPHAMARGLRTQVSRSVGVVLPDLRRPFYADLAAGVAARARARGYTVLLVDDRGAAEDELAAARTFVSTRAAGVVVTPTSAAVTGYLLDQQVPVVEVERQLSPGRCDAVVVDHRRVARRVTEHLLGLGHRRVALLVDGTDANTGAEFTRGHADAVAAAELPADPGLLVPVGRDVDAARRATVGLLTGPDRPTALCAADEVLAEGLWRAVGDVGLRVPEDVSVASFDDAPWMDLVSPGMTAVAQDVVALGAAALDLLLARLAFPDEPPRTVVLDAELVPRGSTAVPRPR
ncbi:LacI family DNA-binding transcriptional regulator [Microlunatus lacustris]